MLIDDSELIPPPNVLRVLPSGSADSILWMQNSPSADYLEAKYRIATGNGGLVGFASKAPVVLIMSY